LDVVLPLLQRLGAGQPAEACSGRDPQAHAPQPGCARLLVGCRAGLAPGHVLRRRLHADDRSGDGAAHERDRRTWPTAGGEVAEDDYNKFSGLARAQEPAASLSAATQGDLDRSLRQRELRRPNGLGDELRAALVADAGTWGGITLLRETGRDFTPAETGFLASLSGHLAEGLKRALLLTALSAHPDDADAGLLVLDDDNSVQLGNSAGQQWIDELRGGDSDGQHLPIVIHAVASRARLGAAGHATGVATARARISTPSGRWLLVRGSMLGQGPDARAAVILEPAPSPELAPLIAAAYGLTDRERLVTQLVAQGHSTNEIADRLHLSAYTVQDHLKSIFDKAVVSARGELVARLFFEHYAPRLANGSPVAPTGWFAPTPASDAATEAGVGRGPGGPLSR
jgi:DNA-binding CsgD family transcriptional regulator